MSDKIAGLIAPYLEKAFADVEGWAKDIEGVANDFFDDAATGLTDLELLVRPLSSTFSPFLEDMFNDLFPKVFNAYDSCMSDLTLLAEALRDTKICTNEN